MKQPLQAFLKRHTGAFPLKGAEKVHIRWQVGRVNGTHIKVKSELGAFCG